jgi:hypothetical protein
MVLIIQLMRVKMIFSVVTKILYHQNNKKDQITVGEKTLHNQGVMQGGAAGSNPLKTYTFLGVDGVRRISL